MYRGFYRFQTPAEVLCSLKTADPSNVSGTFLVLNSRIQITFDFGAAKSS